MTTALNEARFSWLFRTAAGESKPDYDWVIFETEHFAVLPSLGSLVAGWLLVVPKRQVANFSQLKQIEFRELSNLLADVKEKLSVFPGAPFVFEHGGPLGSSVSCGVDQAHLHIVPLRFDLIETVQSDPSVHWTDVDSVECLNRLLNVQDEYLYISNSTKSLLGKLEKPESQWFRRKIADAIGNANEWNYRDYPHLELMKETVNALDT